MRSTALLLISCCLLSSALRPQEGGDADRMRNVLRGLEQGIEALGAIDRRGEAEQLRRIAAEVRQRLEHQGREHPEIREARRQLEVMGFAKAAFGEAGNERLLELIERAMHARQLNLEGRRDEEAMRIRERAPNRANTAELLLAAGKLLDGFGADEKAAAVRKLAEQMSGRERQRATGGDHRTERQVAEHRLEVMRMAVGALVEADRHDAADLIERAEHALRVGLEGRSDREAREIREGAPSRGQQAELLGLAAEILRDRGRTERAQVVAQVARELGGAREPDERGEAARRVLERIEQIEQRLRGIEARLERAGRGR